jgi:hypothetical protein
MTSQKRQSYGVGNPLEHFNRVVYGIGDSQNDERYIDEYRNCVIDCALGPNKLINMQKLNSNG